MKSNDFFTLANGVKIPAVGFGTWQIPSGDVAYNSVAAARQAVTGISTPPLPTVTRQASVRPSVTQELTGTGYL
ncbi:MAG: hypothetical protein MZV63_40445 [Marinilabiliales bacterium]|nr:hypothetical protein [Marinilabiliales bacterium]